MLACFAFDILGKFYFADGVVLWQSQCDSNGDGPMQKVLAVDFLDRNARIFIRDIYDGSTLRT